MGILIGLERVSHEWPGKPVLVDQSMGIDEGDRIGVVGRNGDGKSTLLRIAGHLLEPDAGSVTWRGNLTVGCLGQGDSLDDDSTVGRAVVGDVPDYVWASDARIRRIVDELIGDLDWDAPVGELSGGQRRRCDLARLLAGDYDVLLMDEPTNHLDLRAIEWLADHLRTRWPEGQGALIVVTHDRWFLDEVCERMWEVHDRRIEPFEGGYSAYVQQRVERDCQAAATEERRQNTLRKELNWLSHGAQARSSKPKFRIDAARALIANDPPLRNPLELRRLAVSRLGKQVIEMDRVTFAYPDATPIVEGLDWLIGPGDRYGILGANGAGKSTLLRLMTGRLAPTAGTVKIGASVRFGWMSQHLDALSQKEDWRVLEVLARYRRSYVVGGKEQSPTQLAEGLGFEQRELQSFVRDLSGGQRRRLALLCVILDEPNVLVLDEPGNDLDTDMLAVMEDLLDGWPGTLLLVSHDRYLMERVTDDQFALVDGRVRHVPGGVDEYLRLLEEYAEGADERPVSAPHAGATPKPSGLTNVERRELKKRFDAVGRRLEKVQGAPDELRARMAEVSATDYAALMDAQAELDRALSEIDDLESEWLELSDELGIE
ncbi:ABC-F family ATP-binding cassette domain-containing protein [Thermophilibacter immobilis]|uniref:ABC-F family ATP-binding cassette domain-containing protein n=1 Tax=Thermophilibacter immobilis TaxID=2779519 RepID=A0A7S7M6W3_9ACTN|nr:ABC-F family ATP-binding cassette domain-containing protein [Thermophilibacter immobilis]QOY59831.1 ABC-F family ATP-binding cassette domain-containing protein [Thermophilibacter immobilis]